MFVFLNGELVPEDEARVSVFDRGFLYGDGLFETILTRNGRPFRWEQHFERLRRGAEFLKIALKWNSKELQRLAIELAVANHLPNAVLRVTLSRGVGVRGYSPAGAEHPVVVMTLHPAAPMDLRQPPRWKLVTASPRLVPNDPLAQFKTCNKLPQILARAEAEAVQAQEALLLNTEGKVVEAASSNLFWIDHVTVCTPPLSSGILPGVTRAVVQELCDSLRMPRLEADITPQQLVQTEGVFLSLSSLGIAEGISLDGHALRLSALTDRLRVAYADLVRSETA